MPAARGAPLEGERQSFGELQLLEVVAICDHLVGDVRVFYDVSGSTVEVLAIVAKSEAEAWLAQFVDRE